MATEKTDTTTPVRSEQTASIGIDTAAIRRWLATEVTVRLPRGWLVGGGALVAVLAAVALD